LQEQLTAKETEAAELQNRVDDLDYELQKKRHRADSLENHLAEALEKNKLIQQQQQQAGILVEEKSTGNKVVSVSQKKVSIGFTFDWLFFSSLKEIFFKIYIILRLIMNTIVIDYKHWNRRERK